MRRIRLPGLAHVRVPGVADAPQSVDPGETNGRAGVYLAPAIARLTG